MVIQVTGVYSVAVGEARQYSDGAAFKLYRSYEQTSVPNLTILGSVTVTNAAALSSSAVGVLTEVAGLHRGFLTIETSGSFKVASSQAGSPATGIMLDTVAGGVDVVNRGLVEVSGASSTGLSIGNSHRFENSGSVVVKGGASLAIGVDNRFSGATIINTGEIRVTGDGGLIAGMRLTPTGANVSNAGTISASSTSSATKASAVLFESSSQFMTSFVNSGTLRGDYALKVESTVYGAVYTNTGTMIGMVHMGGYAGSRLVNSGTIQGTVVFGSGSDTYDGRLGSLTSALDGGDGRDVILGGRGAETLNGGADNDTITGGGGADRIDGGEGRDVVSLENSSVGLNFNLASTVTPDGTTILGIEGVVGSAYADTLIGTVGANSILGGNGDDRIFGGAGNDDIFGEGGSNYLRGEEGDDQLFGGDEFDDIHGNQGNDTLFGGGGDDWVVGGQGNDYQRGYDGKDAVYGNLGADTLEGGAGADWIRGGQGNDVLYGDAGDDLLFGDLGSDAMVGGAGADLFYTMAGAGADRISDFNQAEGDRIVVTSGATWTVAQAGADTVVTMAGGASMTLLGVSLSSLATGWIYSG